MKEALFLLIFSCLCTVDSLCQGNIVMDEKINPGGIIEEIPLRPLETSGSVYLNEEFQKGNIFLKNNVEIKNYPIKYDLKYHRMEINSGADIKVLNWEKISKFYFIENQVEYRNVEYYNVPDDLGGFFKVIATGDISLLQHTEIKIIPANYVPETDTGRRSDKIVKDDTYYLSKDKNVFKISGRKNKDLEFFTEKNSRIKEFVQDEKISFKDENDLVKLISFYNTL